jgi:hypothetical protein
MKDRQLFLRRALWLTLLTLGLSTSSIMADNANFGGEYANKKFLNGKAIFQMSLEQTGKTFSVWFSATYEDGHGAAPEAQGLGKVSNKGMAEFMFQDNFGNTGIGTIVRVANEIVVTMQMKKIVDARCMEFYGPKIRLKPAAGQ